MSKEVKGCVSFFGFLVAMVYAQLFKWADDRMLIWGATACSLMAEFVFMKAGDLEKLSNRQRIALGIILCAIMHYLYSRAFFGRIPSYERAELYIGYIRAFFVFVPTIFGTLYFLFRAKKFVDPDILAIYLGYFVVVGYNLFAIFGYSAATDSRFFAVPAVGISVLLLAECMRAVRDTTSCKGKGFEILTMIVYTIGNVLIVMS